MLNQILPATGELHLLTPNLILPATGELHLLMLNQILPLQVSCIYQC